MTSHQKWLDESIVNNTIQYEFSNNKTNFALLVINGYRFISILVFQNKTNKFSLKRSKPIGNR
jgi:hypothetical protein